MTKHQFSFLGQKSSASSDSEYWEIRHPDELHHFRKVLRLTAGDQISVFDGNGHRIFGEVDLMSKKNKILVKVQKKEFQPYTKHPLALCVGALKNSTMEELLPFLCELACDEIHIFMQKNVAKFRTSEKANERWKKIIVSSSKQCKRYYLPKLYIWQSLDEMLPFIVDNSKNRFLLSTEVSQKVCDMMLVEGKTSVVVGGEKGLSNEEQQKLVDHGFSCFSFGNNILRSITAALATTVLLKLMKDKTEEN